MLLSYCFLGVLLLVFNNLFAIVTFFSVLLIMYLQEILDYSHVPGRAVLHRGRHRHGARATTSGHRVNLLLWCRRYLYLTFLLYGNTEMRILALRLN